MLRVERASLADMAGVYRVCRLTDDLGADGSALYADPDLPGHIYAGPYLAYGRGTQLVAVDDEGVAGYLLSVDDSAAFGSWAEEHWWPQLRVRYPRTDDDTPTGRKIRLIHQPEQASAEPLTEYPAHFHVDLLERTRGAGLGRTLMERLFSELRERGVRGVHMGVNRRNTNAIGFYEHLGFETLHGDPEGVTMGMRLRQS